MSDKEIFTREETSNLIQQARREGAITELKLIIKRNSNFKYSRLDMIEFCEKRLEKLQGELE